MKATIAIGSTKEKPNIIEQLPLVRIYETKEGKYLFLEKSVIEEAIELSLKRLETGQPSVILIEVQVVPISQRVRLTTP